MHACHVTTSDTISMKNNSVNKGSVIPLVGIIAAENGGRLETTGLYGSATV